MQILGVDIGGSGIKGAIVDTATGKLVSERHRIKTPQPATPDAVAAVLAELVAHFEWFDRMRIPRCHPTRNCSHGSQYFSDFYRHRCR